MGLPSASRHRRRQHQGHTARDQRPALLHSTRPRVGHRRAHGARNLASHLAIEGRYPHRNRGVGVYGDALYFETPDCNLVSLNLKDGKEKWRKTICDLDQFYYGSVAPVIIKNHVIAGVSGDDLDRSGYIESHDPETGQLPWRW